MPDRAFLAGTTFARIRAGSMPPLVSIVAVMN
jgi:hypothetical protein